MSAMGSALCALTMCLGFVSAIVMGRAGPGPKALARARLRRARALVNPKPGLGVGLRLGQGRAQAKPGAFSIRSQLKKQLLYFRKAGGAKKIVTTFRVLHVLWKGEYRRDHKTRQCHSI